MIESTDQIRRNIVLKNIPDKIVSVVPSQTELLYDLDLGDKITGITKFCIHPSHLKTEKEIVGGTKNLNIDKIRKLSPDLIIANKEENNPVQIKNLSGEFPVWTSDVKQLSDALEMIQSIGRLTGTEKKANDLALKIRMRFKQLEEAMTNFKNIPVVYLIWKNPYMTVGADTFIHDILKRTAFTNIFSDKLRYPEFNPEELKNNPPGMILLSSEPYPFQEKDIAETQKLFPSSRIRLVDGELFSWYGSRLLKSPEYLLNLRREVDSAS
jgi:ABC-type Fe3+-hydroxamate transport system substrate-binding protein